MSNTNLNIDAVFMEQYKELTDSIYGHTAIVNAVSGTHFVTYDQNWNGNQTVELYQKTWDDSMTFVILPPQK